MLLNIFLCHLLSGKRQPTVISFYFLLLATKSNHSSYGAENFLSNSSCLPIDVLLLGGEDRDGSGTDADGDDEDWHAGEDDQGQEPAVVESVDEGGNEDGHEEKEHPNLLTNPLL